MATFICKHCGCQMSDKSEACPVCGAPVGITPKESSYYDGSASILTQSKKHKSLVLWVLLILSLICPPLGLILFFVYRKKRPGAAKGFLFWALYGTAMWLMVFLVLFLNIWIRHQDSVFYS